MIDFRGGSFTTRGPFFEKDAAKTLQQNAENAVAWLTGRGVPIVKSLYMSGIRHSTGATAGGVTSVVLPPRGKSSAYGLIAMRPGMSRQPGSPAYPAARRPYIIASVLETGNYRGHRPRPAIRAFRRARQALQVMALRITRDLAKGLN